VVGGTRSGDVGDVGDVGAVGAVGDVGDVGDVEEWLARLPVRLHFLEEFQTRDEVDLDFSADSLDGLEEYVLARFETPDEVPDDEDGEWLVEGVAAYVGEAMLRLAGGGWRPAADPGRAPGQVPLIRADEALGLPPVSPADLVLAAIRGHDGGEFRRAYTSWERAVQVYRAAHPSWTPTKEPTPGVDPVRPEESEIQYLTTWLAEREQAFPDWVAQYGPGTGWDFSARSLDDLGSLVLRLTPTVAALDDPANRGFVDGAAWYAGEALRRVKGGRWRYRHGDPELNLFAGHPYVEQLGEDGATGVPRRALQALVERQDPHHLLHRYEAFA
jgi:hypothetical protein